MENRQKRTAQSPSPGDLLDGPPRQRGTATRARPLDPAGSRPVPVDPRPGGSPLVIAHRGYSSVAPENTLAAFEAALRCGADMVETDLHPTTDGAVALIHDDEVDATTGGRGRVADLHVDDLARLDAGAWFSPAYRGQRVPLLADLLDLLAEHPGAQLLLELKQEWTAAQVAAAIGVVRRAGAVEQVVVQSFEIATLEHLRDVAPGVRRAVLLEAPAADALAQGRALRRDLGVIACNPGVASLVSRPAAVAELHEAGLAVWPWTVDESALWRALLGAEVDGIITNRPDGLRGWLEAQEEARREAPQDTAALLAAALKQGGRAVPTTSAPLLPTARRQLSGSTPSASGTPPSMSSASTIR